MVTPLRKQHQELDTGGKHYFGGFSGRHQRELREYNLLTQHRNSFR